MFMLSFSNKALYYFQKLQMNRKKWHFQLVTQLTKSKENGWDQEAIMKATADAVSKLLAMYLEGESFEGKA